MYKQISCETGSPRNPVSSWQMLYNERTRKFVLFFHLDTPDFGPVPGQPYSGHVGILTSDKVGDEFGTALAERSSTCEGLVNQAYT